MDLWGSVSQRCLLASLLARAWRGGPGPRTPGPATRCGDREEADDGGWNLLDLWQRI